MWGSAEQPQFVLTDGSGLFPKDAALRITAWGAAWQGATGAWRYAGGPVEGALTVSRAELTAILRVAQHGRGRRYITSDCQGVVAGCDARFRHLARLLSTAMSKTPLGGLWLDLLGEVRWYDGDLSVAWT